MPVCSSTTATTAVTAQPSQRMTFALKMKTRTRVAMRVMMRKMTAVCQTRKSKPPVQAVRKLWMERVT